MWRSEYIFWESEHSFHHAVQDPDPGCQAYTSTFTCCVILLPQDITVISLVLRHVQYHLAILPALRISFLRPVSALLNLTLGRRG